MTNVAAPLVSDLFGGAGGCFACALLPMLVRVCAGMLLRLPELPTTGTGPLMDVRVLLLRVQNTGVGEHEKTGGGNAHESRRTIMMTTLMRFANDTGARFPECTARHA